MRAVRYVMKGIETDIFLGHEDLVIHYKDLN